VSEPWSDIEDSSTTEWASENRGCGVSENASETDDDPVRPWLKTFSIWQLSGNLPPEMDRKAASINFEVLCRRTDPSGKSKTSRISSETT
jgi:hypothetical protein